ncbi:MAG: biopolymer transporter ExbD [Planctomycetes bacterium]|nr:biopolymer transporter ExbD [Planctomycetota bacterium]
MSESDYTESAEQPPYDPHIMRMLQEDAAHDDGSISEMNVIPFIDICLVLLIIVLISSAFSFQLFVFENPASTTFNVIDVKTQGGESNLISLNIHDGKTITLNGQQVGYETLVPTLEAAWQTNKYIAVDFRAPDDLDLQTVINVMEKIQMNIEGIKISLAILETE